ncbi:SDR family NAD(P)-dependent oxidoreductase [Streptomyces sp. NPDC056669]|uniref:SDR family NAD(P)-dependent oxidoreductase n=1 Tax=Streptomyces sp. NPDC056669 TaxID=3345903 RepID=UPI0036A7F5A7
MRSPRWTSPPDTRVPESCCPRCGNGEFITGSSRGFGRRFAEAALSRDDKVAATARDTDSPADLATAHADAVLPLALDVMDKAAATAAVKRRRRQPTAAGLVRPLPAPGRPAGLRRAAQDLGGVGRGVRPGRGFERGHLVERPEAQAA